MQNATRFLVISSRLEHPMFEELSQGKPLKTSLCIGLHENKPGALLAILQTLAQYQLNMSRIESRPTKKMLGEYLFYLDIEGLIPPQAEIAIQEQTSFYKCLGVYPMLGVLT
jgi:prephenate dehydratase